MWRVLKSGRGRGTDDGCGTGVAVAGIGGGHDVPCRVVRGPTGCVMIGGSWPRVFALGQFLASVLKNPFDIQAVSGTSLVIGTSFQVIGQLSGPGVVDDSWVIFTDGVLRSHQNERYLVHVSILRHFGVIIVDGVEAGLVLQAEDEDDGVDPRGELQK